MMAGIYESIKQSITMRELVERYGFEVNRAGFMSCPFHTEDTASLKVYDGNRGWHCFGCGAGGDIIDFTRRLFHITARQAVVRLNNDFGLALMNERPNTEDIRQLQKDRKQKAMELHGFRAEYTAKCREAYEIRHLPQPILQSPLWGKYAAALGRLEYLDYWFQMNHWR